MDCSYSESNFSFAFNDTRFSDMLLHIEILTTADRCKKRRVNGDEASNTNNSIWTVDCSEANNIVRVETLHISSSLLAAKSPVFYKLFINETSESKQRHITLRISASEEAGLMELLKFMYSNTLNITAAPALLDVLMAAHKFQVSSCVSYLLNLPMTIDSALIYLELPHTVDAAQPLIAAAKQYLADRYKDITNEKYKEELMALPLLGIEAILACDDLLVPSEDDVYVFALNWARQKYSNLKERQEVLGARLAPLIRFPYMIHRFLEEALTCSDFEHEGASKLVLEALSFKAEAPDRQQFLVLEESISLSRRFVGREYMCERFVRMRREECVTLFPSGYSHSKPFAFGGHIFALSPYCGIDKLDSFPCFSVALQMKKRYSRSVTADWDVAVCLRPDKKKYVRVVKWKHTFTPGSKITITNLFDVPWNLFIAEDSPFFIKDVLRLRFQLSIAH